MVKKWKITIVFDRSLEFYYHSDCHDRDLAIAVATKMFMQSYEESPLGPNIEYVVVHPVAKEKP